VKVAIPRFGEEVAPCFEYSATIAIFRIENGRVVEQVDFTLQSQDAFDRVRLLRDQDRFEDLVNAMGITSISWVTGNVEDLLARFLQGCLTPGTARLGPSEESAFPKDDRSSGS
jgi:hypothetical protein